MRHVAPARVLVAAASAALVLGGASARAADAPSTGASSSSSSAASPAPASQEDAAPASPLPSWVHGAARYKLFGYPDEGRQKNDLVRNQVEGDLELSPPLDFIAEGLRFQGLLRAVADDEAMTTGRLFDDRAVKRPALNAYEAYLAYENGPIELRAGKQVLTWGKADIANPTDTLNSREFADPFDRDKIGSWSVLARALLPLDVTLEGVLVPVWFIPTRLPRDGARYDFVPPDFPLDVLHRDLPEDEVESSQVGGRASGTIGGPLELDWMLSAYRGFDHEPNTRIEVVPPGVPAVRPYYKREDVYGGGLSRALWRFEAHGECGYYDIDDDDDRRYIESVAGISYRQSAIVDDADEAYAVVEYAWQETLERPKPGVQQSIFSALLERAVLTRLRYSWGGGDVVAEGTAVLVLQHEDNQLYQLSLSYRWRSWLKTTLGADIFHGPSDTFFGQFRDDDRVWLFVEASF